MMHGIHVFKSLIEAIRAGYQVYDKTTTGYLVRQRLPGGWALAVVEVS